MKKVRKLAGESMIKFLQQRYSEPIGEKIQPINQLYTNSLSPSERGNQRNITSPLLGEVCFQLELPYPPSAGRAKVRKQGEGLKLHNWCKCLHHCEPTGEAIQLINKSWITSYLSQTILNRLLGRVLRMTSVRSTVKTLLTYCPSALVSCKSSTPHPLPAGAREHLAAWLPSCLAAFTLAEVLITLGVIGVVAAVTMPTLIEKHQKKVAVTKLKKSYTILSQALHSATIENGNVEEWGCIDNDSQATERCLKNFLTYIKTIKECNNTEGCWSFPYHYRNGQVATAEHKTTFYDYSVIFSDGTLFKFDPTQYGVVADIDINGFKGPNAFGKDIFRFYLEGSIIKPYSASCLDYKGLGCAEKIIQDGWEIKDDYPW